MAFPHNHTWFNEHVRPELLAYVKGKGVPSKDADELIDGTDKRLGVSDKLARRDSQSQARDEGHYRARAKLYTGKLIIDYRRRTSRHREVSMEVSSVDPRSGETLEAGDSTRGPDRTPLQELLDAEQRVQRDEWIERRLTFALHPDHYNGDHGDAVRSYDTKLMELWQTQPEWSIRNFGRALRMQYELACPSPQGKKRREQSAEDFACRRFKEMLERMGEPPPGLFD